MAHDLTPKNVILDAEQMARMIRRMAGEISERNRGVSDLMLVGIRTRGVPLAEAIGAEIERMEGHRVPLGVLDITLYRDDLSKVATHAVLQSSDITFGVDQMDLVLVDDVLYTGRTIRAAMNGLFDLGRPQRVSLCVLIDRGHREMPIEAQFVGRTVQTSDTEIIEVRLREIDNEERVVLVDRQEP
jgi:pyrimidine operon attenuation protein/uracil phosphoribosyltransferase